MITVYTKPRCSQCQTVKGELNSAKIQFEEKPIDDWALSAAREHGWTSAPIVIDYQHPELSFAGLDRNALEILIEAN